MFTRGFLCITLLATATGGSCEPGPGDETPTPDITPTPGDAIPFAVAIEDFSPGEGAGYGEESLPDVVLGPPLGGGENSGGLDVLSLGYQGAITLKMGVTIYDDEGPDFIVFENAFRFGEDPEAVFSEPGQVYASADGSEWFAFPCAHEAFPYTGCAGVSPVLSHPDNGIDPTDPTVAGGDAFDLADIGLETARYIRIEDRGESVAAPSAGLDLDAVSAVNY